MHYDFAPMEGITDHIFRHAHFHFFPGGEADRYYTPFLSPNHNRNLKERRLQDAAPEYNADMPIVPQLLTKNADDFIWMTGVLAEWGYTEVNLNLGCPSGTVAAKGKGAGFLRDPAALNSFLEQIFAASPLPISIKTRLGISHAEEFMPILKIYNQYPVRELIIHPRVQKQLYRGEADRSAFAAALTESRAPVCYNGDLCTVHDCLALQADNPAAAGLMLGRGLVADPALLRRLRGGAGLDAVTLHAFADALYESYSKAFGSEKSAVSRMKALWNYWYRSFADPDEMQRRMCREDEPWAYRAAVRETFACLQLRPGQ